MEIEQAQIEQTLLELFRDQKKHKCAEGVAFVIERMGLPASYKNNEQFITKVGTANNTLITKNLIAGETPSSKSRTITFKGLKALKETSSEPSSFVKTEENNLSMTIGSLIESTPNVIKADGVFSNNTGLDNFLNSLIKEPFEQQSSLDEPEEELKELFDTENVKVEKAVLRTENKVIKLICKTLSQLNPDKYKTLVMELFNSMGYKLSSSEETSYMELRDAGICKVYVYFDTGDIDEKIKESDLYLFTGAVLNKSGTLVFVTQRDLEKDAGAYVKKYGIEVLDIKTVSKLMREHEVGIKKKEISYIAEPDYKYFV